MRVGVGVGAVMLGGCDMVTEAKARVFGEEADVAAATEAAPTPAPAVEAAPAPEPLLLSRGGVAGVVEDLARTKAAPPSTSSSVPPVNDLGRPLATPEGSHAFVPYDGGVGSLAGAPPSFGATATPTKPRPRSKPRVARVDEPCDPALATPVGPSGSGWECGPCGRG
jgi:hypothetical protein